MNNAERAMTEEAWKAIVGSDRSYDGKFVYALTTTGIFCKPGCRSRTPIKTNVRLFDNAEQALTARFRPCKRCKPTDERLPDEEWTSRIAAYIEGHLGEPLTLRTLASHCHGSPYHLQRTFKRRTGSTPAEYIRQTRIRQAQKLLIGTRKPVAEIAADVGFVNAAHFITLFGRTTGQTPAQYRESGIRIEEENQDGDGKDGAR